MIDDVTVKICRGVDHQTGHFYRELIIGYKTIYVNTYVVTVVDLANKVANNTMFKHESFHFWEQQIDALITNKNKDIVTFSNDGINLMTLNSKG